MRKAFFAAELARRRGTVRLGVTNPWDEKWRVGRGATTNYANEPIESDRDLMADCYGNTPPRVQLGMVPKHYKDFDPLDYAESEIVF